MCEECGCGIPDASRGAASGHEHGDHREVELYRNLLENNEKQAAHNREHLIEHSVLGINIMSGPGAGKTSLIEALSEELKGRLRIGVIEGDLATERDAQRIEKHGIPVHQITTGSTCHLDAMMVHHALHKMPVDEVDILIVENVGNLVCPGVYDLGCHLNGVLLSVTEGDDKVAKYPVVFRMSQFFCITKTDLARHVQFDPAKPKKEARIIKGDIRFFETSALTGEGVSVFADWLLENRKLLLG